MPKRKGRAINRKDKNQPLFEEVLKRGNYPYHDCSQFGDDFPDLLVGTKGLNAFVLFEIKMEGCEDEIDQGQFEFAWKWRGYPVFRVVTPEEMLKILSVGAPLWFQVYKKIQRDRSRK